MLEFRGYAVRHERVAVGGGELELLVTAAPETLLDDPRTIARFASDESMPYWATLWPAARLLAAVIATWQTVPPGTSPPHVLDLGCGLGLVGLVAARRGYAVTLADHDEDALAFAAHNARHNAISLPPVRLVDWRATYADLRVDRLLAADVLYEARNVEPVARFVRDHLCADGFALLADPNRAVADTFSAAAQQAGLAVTAQTADELGLTEIIPNGGRIFRATHSAACNEPGASH